MTVNAMSYNEPLKRLLGWVAVFDHPNEFGCYPNCMLGEFETTPCFSRRDSCGKQGGKRHAH